MFNPEEAYARAVGCLGLDDIPKDLVIAICKNQYDADRFANLCDICCGTGKTLKDVVCICKGTGRMSETVEWFRNQFFQEDRLEEMANHLSGAAKILEQTVNKLNKGEKIWSSQSSVQENSKTSSSSSSTSNPSTKTRS